MKRLRYVAVGMAICGTAATASAGGVTLNSSPVPGATSTVDTAVDIAEYREGGDRLCSRLLAGCKRYGVCIAAPAPVAVLDAMLPQSSEVEDLTVGVEDGRQFARCLLSGLTTALKGDDAGKSTAIARGDAGGGKPGKHWYTYCFKCEDVTTPAP